MTEVNNAIAHQFTVMRLTGIQIYRRLSIIHLPEQVQQAVWEAAVAGKGKPPRIANELLGIVSDFAACDQLLEASDWMACSPTDGVFFRLLRVGTSLAADLMIDTQAGAGRMERNLIYCVIDMGWPFWKTRHHLASFFVSPNDIPRNEPGSLIMDFGNTATSFIFARQGALPQDARPLALHNPFDIWDERRTLADKQIFRSTAMLIRIQDNPATKPWLLLGMAAEERIPTIDPLVTSVWAPKKFIRDWPEHLRPQEPTVACQGVVGQRTFPVPTLYFVELAIEQMLTLAISSQTNPHFHSHQPDYYPQIREVLLTYPLTWREQERSLFANMVRSVAQRQFVLPEPFREQFQVQMVCSEPVAVAAYVLWEVFFHFLSQSPDGAIFNKPCLVSSMLGNLEGEPEIRLLVLDVGGGSTDIALVQANWNVEQGTEGVNLNVHTRVLESLRYGRAGDRLSHIMATAILEFMRQRYGLNEVLDFNMPAMNPGFTRAYKRAAISEISSLVEKAKTWLATYPEIPWALAPDDEAYLLTLLEQARSPDNQTAPSNGAQRIEISIDVLRHWVDRDRQSMKTRGEPGLMDVFFDLKELGKVLRANGQFPHLVLISGRTSRLSFFKELTMQYLGLPAHRVRAIADVMPSSLSGVDRENIDKLAVVHGAHRFKFGYPIRFTHHQDEPVFRRYIGVLTPDASGWRLGNRVFAAPGDSQPQTCPLRLSPNNTLQIGHAFRRDGARAEVIATVENLTSEWQDIEIDLINDYHVALNRCQNAGAVRLSEHFTGGTVIVDNFYDTGRIDREPDGLLREIVLSNEQDWLKNAPMEVVRAIRVAKPGVSVPEQAEGRDVEPWGS